MNSTATRNVIEPALERFALRLQDLIGADSVLLVTARGRDPDLGEGDEELIIVSPSFAGVEWRRRQAGLRDIWWELGGRRGLHLICVTSQELAEARARMTPLAGLLPRAIDLLSSATTPS